VGVRENSSTELEDCRDWAATVTIQVPEVAVDVWMVIDGRIVDSATFSVAGYQASGSCRLRHRNGQGGNYEIVLIVADSAGNTDSATDTIRSQGKVTPRSR